MHEITSDCRPQPCRHSWVVRRNCSGEWEDREIKWLLAKQFLRDYMSVSLKNNLSTVSIHEFIWKTGWGQGDILLQRGLAKRTTEGLGWMGNCPLLLCWLWLLPCLQPFIKSPKLHISTSTPCHAFFQFRNLWLHLFPILVSSYRHLLWLQNYFS